MQNGVKHEGRAHYSIWLVGELVGNANNPTQAQAKFEKEVARAQMNAERDASTTAWKAQRAEIEYSFAERSGMVAA